MDAETAKALEPGRRGGEVVFVLESDAFLRSLLLDILQDHGRFLVFAFRSLDQVKSVAGWLRPTLLLADPSGDSYGELTSAERRHISELTSIAPTILITAAAWASKVT